MSDGFLFTSESVTEGHPDKVADQISDAIVDAALTKDPQSRVAVETLLTTGLCVLAGEITTSAVLDFAAIARQVICDIGYDSGEIGYDGNAVGVLTALDRQSPDIARGVASSHDARIQGSTDPFDAAGAGDQGMMFGYATSETPQLMPMPIMLAHQLARRLARVRRNGLLPYLRPDGKTQVTVRYDAAGRPVRVEKVLISTQHEDGVEAKLPDALWEQVVTHVLPPDMYDPLALRREFYVNPTGRFVIGGPVGDTGLTGRKIIVDTYGGFARHGGGAFSGKDPSKVDRSASYAARHVAKNIVAAGLADRAEVQVAYAIGMARPLSLLIETFGTEKVPRPLIADLVRTHFDLRPAALIQALDLRRPIYRPTAAYGHFGRDEAGFTWERTDRAAALRTDAGLLSERSVVHAPGTGSPDPGASAGRAQRADVLQRAAQPVLFHLEVVAGLQVQPEPLRGAEVPGQAQRGVRGDAPLAVDDLVDPPGRHVDRLGQLVLADSQRGEELLQQDLPRVHRRHDCVRCHVPPPQWQSTISTCSGPASDQVKQIRHCWLIRMLC
jgi:S-adenosylmethionine synthetase